MLHKSAWNIFLSDQGKLNVSYCGAVSEETFGAALTKLPSVQLSNNDQDIDLLLCAEQFSAELKDQIWKKLPDLSESGLFIFLTDNSRNNQNIIEMCQEAESLSIVTNMTLLDDTLYDDNLNWTTFIPRTGKVDYVKRLYRNRFSKKDNKKQLIIYSKGNPDSWLLTLIDRLADLNLAQKEVEIGRIDKMRTGNYIVQLQDARKAKFALKVINDHESNETTSNTNPWLEELTSQENIPCEIRQKIPKTIIESEHKNASYQLEAWMTGQPASLYFYNRKNRERIIDTAIDWSVLFQTSTRNNTDIQTDHIKKVISAFAAEAGMTDTLSSRITDYISSKLSAHPCPSVGCHGDFWIANILVDSKFDVTGVIDWDFLEKDTTPLIDILHLLFHEKTLLKPFKPWKELERTFRGKMSERNLSKICYALNKLGIHTELFPSLLLFYWVKYLDTRLRIFNHDKKWIQWAFKDIYELLSNQTTDEWEHLGKQVANAANHLKYR